MVDIVGSTLRTKPTVYLGEVFVQFQKKNKPLRALIAPSRQVSFSKSSLLNSKIDLSFSFNWTLKTFVFLKKSCHPP